LHATWDDSRFIVVQEDTWDRLVHAAPGAAPMRERPRALLWPQVTTYALGMGDSVVLVRGPLHGRPTTVPIRRPEFGKPSFILGGVDGVSYGRIVLGSASRVVLPARLQSLPKPLHRAVAWQTLYEEMLDGTIPPAVLLDAALGALRVEREELVVLQVLGLLRGIYWRFLPDADRRARAPQV